MRYLFIRFCLALFAFPTALWGQWEKLPTRFSAVTSQVQSFDNQLFCHTTDAVYRSKNEGQSWELFIKALCCNNGYHHFLNINQALKHYYFINEETGEIQISKDNGSTWQVFGQMPVNTPFFERHRGLFFKDNKVYVFQRNYIAVRESGGTVNGWRPLLTLPDNNDTLGFIYKVIQSNTHLWAETNLGIYHSPDFGSTWTKPLGNTLRRMTAKGDTLLVYSGGLPSLRSLNNGATWQTIQMPFKTDNILQTPSRFYCMSSVDTLMSSLDGEHWSFVNKNLYVSSVAELNRQLYLTVPDYGILQGNMLKSGDGGATLFISNQGLPNSKFNQPSARFVDDYLHLSDGLGVSDDDGDTWGNRWNGYSLSPQQIFRAGNYYIGQYNIAGTYFSPQICPANGRFEWETPVAPAVFLRITAVGDQVYGAANQTQLFRTAPDGKSWTQTGSVPISDFLLGWRDKLYSTDGTKIVYSANEGQSWQTAVDFGSAFTNITRFFVVGDTLLFSHVTNRKIYYLKNDGTSLDTIPVPQVGSTSFFRLRAHGRTLVLYLGDEEAVYVSNNRGQSWLKIPFPPGVAVNNAIDQLTANPHTLIVSGNAFVWRLRYDGLRNLHGRVYLDANANNVQDASEPGLPDRLIAASNSGFIAKTGEKGLFNAVLSKSADTLRLADVPSNFVVSPSKIVVSATDTAAVKLALQPIGSIRDAAVKLIVPTPFRAGFANQISLLIANQGTLPVSPRLRLTLDPNLSFESASIAPAFQNADSVVWNLTNLPLLQSTTITVRLKTAVTLPAVPVALALRASVAQEKTPADNVATYNGAIVASYDPNDKTVSPTVLPPAATDRKTLTYTIRFQNLGNAATDFVVIRDTLPDRLDPTQIRVLGSSHPMTWRLLQGKILEFRFNPLFLPPATQNEPGSHGFVQFSIAARPGLAVGDAIKNKAYIYFDFNPAIITNTATTEVKVVSVAVLPNVSEKLTISPNPTKGRVKLTCNSSRPQPGQIRIFTMQGQLCYEAATTGTEHEFATDNLPAGTYLVSWQTGEHCFWGKLEVL